MALIYYFLLFIHLKTICFGLPNVYVRPSTAVLLSSSETRLICESRDTPSFDSIAYWTHAGQRIELNPSIIEMHGNELRIFQFGDTAYTQPGAYACVVSTRYGLMESEPALLSLPTLDPFKLSKNEENIVNLTEGNTAVIPCDLPNANPRALAIFYFDHHRLDIDSSSTKSSGRYRILPSGNLHIIDVQLSDAGTYQCSAKNLLTEQIVNNSQITTLHVQKKPSTNRERQPLTTIIKPRAASRVLVGDNFTIECVITGWPKPTIEWEKYGDILPERRHEVLDGTLHLYDIRLDDRGTYICRASNANGQSDLAYTALLEVLEPPRLVQRPDSLIQIKNDERVSIRCGFRGRPEPTISWLFNGEELIMNDSPMTGGLLSLTNPKEGIYQCIGRNSYGSAQANVALVSSIPMTSDEFDFELPTRKSLIVFGPNNVTVSEGETVQLHCLTQAGSTVQWLHNNQMININIMRRYELLPSGGLRIVSAQRSDSGIYECLASKIGFGTNTAKSFVHIQGLALNVPVSKLEIIQINQIKSNAIELLWKINETIENYVNAIQIQYRLAKPKESWMTINDLYNRSINTAVVDQLSNDETYKFRLIGFDVHGKQLVISATKRYTLQTVRPPLHLPWVEISDAWITKDGQISVKWQIANHSNKDMIDGFILYYRQLRTKTNFTTVKIPNLSFPIVDTYSIASVEPNQQYELRIATYSNQGGLSPMSNPIEITTPDSSSSRTHPKYQKDNLDEILENITRLQTPSRHRSDLLIPSSASSQKSSDLLYLTIGIVAGILFILILILLGMCVLRFIQRKKLLTHMRSVNGSDYYGDGMHRSLNPDYPTSPCLQHAVVSIDGKLIPFACPSSVKSPKLFWPPVLPTNPTTVDSGTMRLNSNPMNQLDHDNLIDKQENFYHTLTPFNCSSHYEECKSHTCSHSSMSKPTTSSCVMYHRSMSYASDTLRSKQSSYCHPKINGFDPLSPSHTTPCHQIYHSHHQQHGVCQRPAGPTITEDAMDHYCAHSTQPSTQINEHSAPSSTGSSSGIGSCVESPYNHWRYLTPLAITTSNDPKPVALS